MRGLLDSHVRGLLDSHVRGLPWTGEPDAAAEFDRTMVFIQKTIDTLRLMDAEVMAFVP